MELRALRVAREWGIKPAEFRALSIDDRAMMLTLDMFEGMLDSRRDEYRKEKAKKKGSAADQFEAMKRNKGLT